MPTPKSYTFASHTSQPTSQSLQKSMPFQPHRHSETADRKTMTEKEQRRHNRRLAKKRIQWLIEHSTSYQILCWVDSFVLRIPLLRQAPNRYAPF